MVAKIVEGKKVRKSVFLILRPNSSKEKLNCVKWINNISRADVIINTLQFCNDTVCKNH